MHNHGIPDKFGPIVGNIFKCIIKTQLLLLSIPIVSYIVASFPLLLETLREFVGNVTDKLHCKFDLFHCYYVTLAPYFGLSLFVADDKFTSLKYEVIALQPNNDEDHMGSAQRVLIGDKKTKSPLFWVVNIHLVHYTMKEGMKMREDETSRVLQWMEPAYDSCDKAILMGDHNTLMRNEKVMRIYKKEGYVSAYKEVNGKEPKSTWPSGIQAVFMDLDGVENNPKGVCLDYIMLKNIEVTKAKLVGK